MAALGEKPARTSRNNRTYIQFFTVLRKSEPATVQELRRAGPLEGDILYRFALSRLRDAEAAEEVTQETFVAARGARDQYSGMGLRGEGPRDSAEQQHLTAQQLPRRPKHQSQPDSQVGNS